MRDSELSRGFGALRQLIQRGRVVVADGQAQCDLCSEPILSEHRHMLEAVAQEILCVCRPCSILFDKHEASEGRYRLIPERRLYLDEFQMDAIQWANFNIPVEMAFFFYSTPEERVRLFYPSAMGPTESVLKAETWQSLAAASPILNEMAADVEALLVNRTQYAPGYFLVPIDDCYRLVALLRRHWKGLSGGREVWNEVERFFSEIRARAQPVTHCHTSIRNG